MFVKNVELKGPVRMSPWRKIAVGTWNSCGDPSVYGTLEIDAIAILARIAAAESHGTRLTPTVVVAQALARSLREYPLLNSFLRWGKLYERRNIDVFFQAAPSTKTDNLSGVVIRDCDRKSCIEIAGELTAKTQDIKTDIDPEYRKMKNIMKLMPTFLVKPLLKVLGFLLYDLNLWSPLLRSPQDAFGSVMVSSIGMLGIDNGLAPLVPYSRCPFLLTIGRIVDKPLVVDGEIKIRPVLKLGITLDHRNMDGKGVAPVLKLFRQLIADPKA